MQRFGNYAYNINTRKCDYEELTQIPGTNIHEPLNIFADYANCVNNRMRATSWCKEIGTEYPKFCILACVMCMYESFSILEKIPRGDYNEYDEILNGLWIHYMGSGVPTVVNKLFSPNMRIL